MKKTNLLRLLIIFTVVLSCGNDTSTGPQFKKNAILKQKTSYQSLESITPLSICDFEYDNDWKLIKMSYYGGDRRTLWSYELYEYGSDNRVSKKINYHSNINSPTGFIILDSTNYHYQNDLLVEETIYNSKGSLREKYTFEYENNRLVKQTFFDKQELYWYIEFEYDNSGNGVKESHYWNTGVMYRSVLNEFHNKLLTKSSVYNNELYRIREYKYDKNGNLIIETSREMRISSMMDFVLRYKYY